MRTRSVQKHAHQPPAAAPPPPRVMVFLPTAAYIVGLAVQCTFFGLALATFVLCIHALTRVPFSAFTRSRWALFAVSIAMIAVGALSVGQAIAHNLEAFVYYKGGTAAMEELNLDQDPAIWIHSITYPVMGFLGDSVLVYRTWVVNSRDWRFIAFPCLLVLGSFLSGWGIVYTVGALETGVYLAGTVRPFTDAFLACSITLNILCTGMISWRIISVTRTSSALSLVTRVVVESALLYTITSILFLITNVAQNASVYIVADAYLQIIPLCFNLIIIRTSNIREDVAGRYDPSRAGSSGTTTGGTPGGGGVLSTLPAQYRTNGSGLDRSAPFFASTFDVEEGLGDDDKGVPLRVRRSGATDATQQVWSHGASDKTYAEP